MTAQFGQIKSNNSPSMRQKVLKLASANFEALPSEFEIRAT